MTGNRVTGDRDQVTESGNVFLFILIGVVLFAALGFSVSRGFRSNTTSTLSKREAALAAADIFDYAQKVERAVNLVRRRGCSENEISFENDIVSGYDYSTRDECKIFGSTGGSISWTSPATGVNDGSEWVFTGATCIADLGTGATGCDSDTDTSNEELFILLGDVDDMVCDRINNSLSISSIPTDTGGGLSSTKFIGDFADGTEIILSGGPYSSACFSDGSDNYFYTVILAR